MIENPRPEPDALLAEAAREGRGRLKVFVGAAPGVGKTYAMLQAGQHRRADGVDVVAGVVETHGRRETERLLIGFERQPAARVAYAGRAMAELDLDGLLRRHPQLVLVDELAHSNAPGSRHPKRWQDVEELLAAGIDVYTTLNIQHLESLNDIVERISRVRVRETLPDKVLELADEIELIDLPPEELIERLRAGKVYVGDQIARAMQNFFSKGNLTALRELAMRVAADRVDAQMTAHMRLHAIPGPWPTQERIMVCVNEAPVANALVRGAKRMADRARVPWLAVNVATPQGESLPDAAKDAVAASLRLAESLGAEIVTLNAAGRIADEIVETAISRNVSRIVVGRARSRRFFARFGRESVAAELIRKSSAFDLTIISSESRDDGAMLPGVTLGTFERDPKSYVWAAAGVLVATGVAAVFNQVFPVESLSLFFLVAVLVVAARFGLWPSLFASVFSFLSYNFFLTKPHFTLSVSDRSTFLTLFLFLVVSIVTGNLAARLRQQIRAQKAISKRTANLFDFSRKVASAASLDDVVWAGVHHVASTLQCAALILMPEPGGRLAIQGGYPPEDQLEAKDWGAAEWAWGHQEPAGWGSATLPAADWFFLPVAAAQTRLGILGVRFPTRRLLTPEERRVLDAIVDQVALAVERAQLATDMAQARLLTETESLRAALLSSVSHDLRTPLVSIIGAASSLVDSDAALGEAGRRDLAETIRDEGERLNRYVQNLLDMTRLSYGGLKLRRQAVDVRELVGRAVHRLRRLLARHRLETNLSRDLPDVSGDPALLEQVIANVLDNAAKHASPDGPIAIAARVEEAMVVVEIADAGPGIPPEDREAVFDMFYRVRAGDGQPSGTGLGLAICKGIVDAHGGAIAAHGRKDGRPGTVIVIRLPIDRSADTPRKEE